MTTRPIIRTRPGAVFITILASLAILNILVLAAGCSSDRKTASSATQQCASDNGGLTLPDGFCATVFADSVGHARHLVVASRPKQHAEPMPPKGGAQLSQPQPAAVAAYVWSLSHT